ncbi:Major facilitator superfamily associated domain [Trinorchestia longiramus]|nr:Major facilitator superfamily associated domain [Trinorchestia longiramus]
MINKSTFLLKFHYFLLFGGIASIQDYGIHYTMLLGATLANMSTLGIVILVCILLLKPVLSMAVDAFPRTRRLLFVCTVVLLCTSAFFMIYVPSFKNPPSYSTAWVAEEDVNVSSLWNDGSDIGQDDSIKDLNDFQSCNRTTQAKTRNSSYSEYFRWSQLQIILPNNDTCKLQEGADCKFGDSSLYLLLQRTGDLVSGYSTYSVSTPGNAYVECSNSTSQSSLHCSRGEYVSGDCGGSVVYTAAFWGYAVLLLIREFTTTTAVSFTDAVTLDTVGTQRNYGWQRLWGVVGWGVMGPLAAAILSYYKGLATVKDHSKAFTIASIFWAADILVSCFIKAPEVQRNEAVWSETKRLLSNSKFLLFLFFSLMSGIFNVFGDIYGHILLWQMTIGSPSAAFLPYFSLALVLIRFLSQLPWMYNADKLVKKFGARKLFSVIFIAHTLRLGLNAAVGQWGPVWGILIVEIVDGPVYGLGYPLVVLYARQFTPPGLTNTVQSLANNAYDMLGFAIASAISAPLMSSLGTIPMFWVFTFSAAVTSALHLICHLCGALLKNDGSPSGVEDVLQLTGSHGEEFHKSEDR